MVRAEKPCRGCGARIEAGRRQYCPPCRVRYRTTRTSRAGDSRTSTQKGYGKPHQDARKRFARVVLAGLGVCSRCGLPIAPDAPWDLDHADDRSGYLGPAHRSCNRRAGAIKKNTGRSAGTWSAARPASRSW